MPGNPWAQPVATDNVKRIAVSQVEATLALAFEVRTVALLLASTMAGTADSADDQYETAMRRMGRSPMSDDLRDKIAEVIQAATDNGASKSGDYAQAVIDDLGLVEERTVRVVDYGAGPLRIPEARVVGKWER